MTQPHTGTAFSSFRLIMWTLCVESCEWSGYQSMQARRGRARIASSLKRLSRGKAPLSAISRNTYQKTSMAQEQ